jgi:hypothetical protein
MAESAQTAFAILRHTVWHLYIKVTIVFSREPKNMGTPRNSEDYSSPPCGGAHPVATVKYPLSGSASSNIEGGAGEQEKMLGKPKLPFLVSDANRLDNEFYCGYDERFLSRTVSVFWSTLNDSELLDRFVEKDSGPEETTRMRHAMAAEILFAEFHQFESFFAMLMARFQKLPHWIYLNTYSTADIKTKARHFVENRFNELSGGTAPDGHSFLRQAIYNGLESHDANPESWVQTFENLRWRISPHRYLVWVRPDRAERQRSTV